MSRTARRRAAPSGAGKSAGSAGAGGTHGTPGTHGDLSHYHAKRNFDVTPEPPALVRRKTGAGRQQLNFFIQRHHARRLHYDFRLELDGVLKSWAVPKGPSLDPHDKRLAVRVEDHPVDYGSFEGSIPEHQYGAGEVVLWDRGDWIPEGDAAAGLKKGHLAFELRGEKLEGRWALVRMGKPDPSGAQKENWLLIKENDDASRSGKAADITALRPESVAGRKQAQPLEADAGAKKKAKTDIAAMPEKSPMPTRLDPQLATLSDLAPQGDHWLSEMKFDGYRGLCRIDQGQARIFTRQGLDWSERWPVLTQALTKLDVDNAWIDGEVVALLQDGSISFEALQNYADGDLQQAEGVRLALYAFDLLYLNGRDLRELPLQQRKELLRALIPGASKDGLLLYSEHIIGHAREVFEHACMHGMEGIVAKRVDAPYSGRRDGNWLKIKCQQRQEFVVAGYTDPAGQRSGFGAILVGVYEAPAKKQARSKKEDLPALRYAGRVGTGFDEKQLQAMLKTFRKLERDTPAFDNPPTGQQARGVHWLEPKLVAEVKFAQWTRGGIVRHGAFVALREDKPARAIVREVKAQSEVDAEPTVKSKERKVSAAAAAQARRAGDQHPDENAPTRVEGVRLTHPAKILFAEDHGPGVTKLELARYYQSVGALMLPDLQQRPLSLVRCPDGSLGKCFFQKHIGQGVPQEIEEIAVPEGKGQAHYMMVNSGAALVATVQMGVLELHTWGAVKGRLDKPDRVVFDLDPAPDVAWIKVIEGAQLLHGLLQEIGLQAFLKTSGGKGLHIVVPIRAQHDWSVVKAWSRGVAEHLAQHLPDHFIATMSKAARSGKIFVDYLRNAPGATTVAAYSARARANAPVSTPITWDELTSEMTPDRFNVRNMGERLAWIAGGRKAGRAAKGAVVPTENDPWRDFAGTQQALKADVLKLFGGR
jgi:bifunctional non-homologous end joining protein LigD